MRIGDNAEILQILQSGSIEIEGLLPWSSNYAFLVRVCDQDVELQAVYKPSRGERPLWDFPEGTLSFRERAAFLVSETLGWHLVPPTVLRDGKHGTGSVQLFIQHDPEQHYFSFEGQELFREPLQKMVLLDVIINNADRKGGHVILEDKRPSESTAGIQSNGRIWGIDHGICFHADFKLRTVIWEFAGLEIPQILMADMAKLARDLNDDHASVLRELQKLLNQEEIDACRKRLRLLLQKGLFPHPGPGRHYPWPPV